MPSSTTEINENSKKMTEVCSLCGAPAAAATKTTNLEANVQGLGVDLQHLDLEDAEENTREMPNSSYADTVAPTPLEFNLELEDAFLDTDTPLDRPTLEAFGKYYAAVYELPETPPMKILEDIRLWKRYGGLEWAIAPWPEFIGRYPLTAPEGKDAEHDAAKASASQRHELSSSTGESR